MTISDDLRDIASALRNNTARPGEMASLLEAWSYQLDEAAEVLGGLSFPDTSEGKEADAVWFESMDMLEQVQRSLGHAFRNMHQKTGHKNIYCGHKRAPSKATMQHLKKVKQEHNDRI